MQSIENKVELAIKKKPLGQIFFPDDFASLGSSDAIRKSLERLENKEVMERVAHGIYVRPKQNEYIGKVLPSAEQIADAISRRDKIRTVPSGTYALNSLGLSTQIPMKIVLLTDGSSREIKVGKRIIKFKKTTPKNLLAKGKISRLTIQALKEIGIKNVDEEFEQKIIDILEKEEQEYLRHDIRLAPVWIQKIMKKAL